MLEMNKEYTYKGICEGLGWNLYTGGNSKKAQIKENIIPYVIGCVIIFGAFGIWKIVLTVLQSFQ